MKKVVLFFTLFSSLISDAQIPTWQWANAYGGSDFESPTNVAVGANGDVYLAGRFSSPSVLDLPHLQMRARVLEVMISF
jgi:hypothetical protein